MYVGSTARNLGYGRRSPAMRTVVRPPLVLVKGTGGYKRRGMGWAGEGASQATCPSGQWNPNLGVCCAPGDGTVSAMGDPCSLFNQSAYESTQAQAQADAEAGDAGDFSSELTALNGFTQPVQTAALTCWNNPGHTYVDPWGNTITCPSASVNMNGILVSAYNTVQLAQMLGGQITGPQPNNAYTGTTVTNPNGAGSGASSTATGATPVSSTPSVRINKTSFNVGDAWQVVVTGPPNAQVTASATQNGSSLGTSSIGTIGSNGQLIVNGTMAASQAGSWSESWQVGGVNAGTVNFSVSSGSSGTSSDTTGTANTAVSSFLSGSTSVAGLSIPTWALLGGGALLLFMAMGKH